MEAPKVIWAEDAGSGINWDYDSGVWGVDQENDHDARFIRAGAPELVALVEALRETRERMLSVMHSEFDGVWSQSDFDDESKQADDALSAWEALTND